MTKNKFATIIAKEYHATLLDPTMQQTALLIRNSKLTLKEIAKRCGVTTQCMNNWLAGRTRRPQALTLKFVLRALGYDLRIMPAAGHNRGGEDSDD